MAKVPLTPCIGVCSTGIGDDVCRGCKRFADEVVRWNGFNIEERRAVIQRLDKLLVETVKNKITIVDADRLKQQIQFQQIAFDEDKDPYCWVFELLRYGASQIKTIEDFGIEINSEWKNISLFKIKAAIDSDFYELSCAYYQRYIVPGQSQQTIP